MALWRRSAEELGTIIVVSLAGREDLLPDVAYVLRDDMTTIGRHDSCTIQVVDGEISRQHLQVRRDGSEYYASDMGSANGTRVNGHRINGEVRLCEGDRIEIGSTRMIFTRKRFKDHKSAVQHFHRSGEHVRGTLVQNPHQNDG